MSKNLLLMREVITKHHPDFMGNRELSRYALSHPHIFDVTRLVEESFAAVGGYNFVDGHGHDFDDPVLSDSKTTTICNNGGNGNAKVFSIGSVEHKVGSLRVIIYNPWAERLDFMYLTKADVCALKENDGTKGSATYTKQKIRGTWSEHKDHYNKMEPYRIDNFVELATIMV